MMEQFEADESMQMSCMRDFRERGGEGDSDRVFLHERRVCAGC